MSDFLFRKCELFCSILLGGEATLVFSSNMQIRGIHLESQILFPMVENVNNSTSVAINKDYIYWSEVTENGNQKIMKMLMNGLERRENVVNIGKRFSVM